ncbi:MAG: hypothetical protein KKE93_04745 [Nanoarchaeota archaeon]|nr:hypothetical protein [Nanoarchaeota archaeon]
MEERVKSIVSTIKPDFKRISDVIEDNVILNYFIDNLKKEVTQRDINFADLRNIISCDYYLRFNKKDKKEIIQLLNKQDSNALIDYCTLGLIKKEKRRYNKKPSVSNPFLKYCNDMNVEILSTSYIGLLKNNEIKSLIKQSHDIKDLKAIIFMDVLMPMLDKAHLEKIINSELNPEQKALEFAKEYQICKDMKRIKEIFLNLNEEIKHLEGDFFRLTGKSGLEELQALVNIRNKIIRHKEKYNNPEQYITNAQLLTKDILNNDNSLNHMIEEGIDKSNCVKKEVEINIKKEIDVSYSEYKKINDDLSEGSFESYLYKDKLKEKEKNLNKIIEVFDFAGDERLDEVWMLKKTVESKIKTFEDIIYERYQINSYIKKVNQHNSVLEAAFQDQVFEEDISLLCDVKKIISTNLESSVYPENKAILEEYKSHLQQLKELFDKKVINGIKIINKSSFDMEEKHNLNDNSKKGYLGSFVRKKKFESAKKELSEYRNQFNKIKELIQT